MARTDAALAEYDIASQLNPGLASAHFEAAKALSAKGDTGAAAERARRGLELEPQSFYGRYTLGVVLQKAGQWPEAFVEFERAVALNGSDPRARANLASTALRTNRRRGGPCAVRSNDRAWPTRSRRRTSISASWRQGTATARRRNAGTSSRSRQIPRSNPLATPSQS